MSDSEIYPCSLPGGSFLTTPQGGRTQAENGELDWAKVLEDRSLKLQKLQESVGQAVRKSLPQKLVWSLLGDSLNWISSKLKMLALQKKKKNPLRKDDPQMKKNNFQITYPTNDCIQNM